MHGMVAFNQRRRIGSGQFAVGILQCLCGQIRIQAHKGLLQATLQHDIAVIRIAPFSAGFTGRNLRAVEDGIPKGLEPGQSGIFNNGFSETHFPVPFI
jgi:hypothetical protein